MLRAGAAPVPRRAAGAVALLLCPAGQFPRPFSNRQNSFAAVAD
jgi:hypothetical protein